MSNASRATTGPPFFGVVWDDDLEKTPPAIQAVSEGQFQAEKWLIEHAQERLLSLPVVLGLHRAMFQGVFPEAAGRLRGPAPRFIPPNVEFGNHRGERYEDVLSACETLFARVETAIHQLDDLQPRLTPEEHREQVLRAAAYVHCEMVRIHPFVNGNGRTSRLCVNYFAARYGAMALPVARPGGDYIDAIRTWFYQRTLEHFVDYLRPLWKPLPDEPDE